MFSENMYAYIFLYMVFNKNNTQYGQDSDASSVVNLDLRKYTEK